jgi:hypothetical protein
MNQNEIVEALLAAARGVIVARYPEQNEPLWAGLEPSLRDAAAQLVRQAVESQRRFAVEPQPQPQPQPQERQIARAVQEILAREGREDRWKEAVSMLADCAISAARDNVDAEYAMSLVENDARTWYSDLRDEGEFWVRPALAGMIGEPDEWLSYTKSVYHTINPEILKGAIELTEKRKRSGKTWAVRQFDGVLKAKAMTAKRAKEVGLPDFHVAAQKAVAFAKKYVSENYRDFMDYAEASSIDNIGDWDDEQVTYCAGFTDEIRSWAGELKVSDWRDFRKELSRALVAEAQNVLRDRVVRVWEE